MPPKPGDRFGRYELAELLGKGGMGEVYSAQDTLLHRRVALKVLLTAPDGTAPAPPSSATGGGARILREARAAAALSHPNAIAIYDVGEVDGVPFLAMELVAGKSLRAFIGDESVAIGTKVRWLVDVARALAAAHEIGLVHRDIKPENIMVRSDGAVKVLDFGIARHTATKVDANAATEGVSLGTLTADGIVVGTPFYMAPEQMRGEPLDGRADQFAWGVVAYELLTGVLPWDRDANGLQLVSQILSRQIEPPRAKNAQISDTVDAAVRRALSKSAQGRFGSMEEVAAELESDAASPGSTTGRSHRRPAAPSTDAVAYAPTQGLPVSGSGAAQAPSTRTQLAAPRSADAPPRKGSWMVAAVAAAVLATLGVGAGLLLRAGAERQREQASSPDASVVAATESRMSANPEATAAYRAGLQALRDGAVGLATQRLDRAIELDPSFAAAHLRRALLADEEISTEMRQDLASARTARESLGENDRILLDAMEPWTRSPPDLRESELRLAAAVKRNPSSADLAFQLGWTLHNAYKSAEAAAAFDAALAKDPTFALAWSMKARERINLDDIAGAIEAYGQCLKVSPSATSCLGDLATIQANEGKCDDMASTSRRLIAVAPDDPDSYGRLAEALFGLGQPIDAVRAALEQKWNHFPAARRSNVQLLDEAALAVLTGHFDEAERKDRDFERIAASSSRDYIHFLTAYDRVLIDLETGRNAEALRVAGDYLRRRSAWQADELSLEPTISIYAAQVCAGGLSKADFGKLRDEWLARDRRRIERVGFVAAAYAGTEWALAWALPATTSDEAVAAVASRPDVHPLIEALLIAPYFEQPIGRAYLLAGDLDGAISVLTRAKDSCAVLSSWAPMFSTWAAFDLGQALELRGDHAGACAAYARVVQRWGAAKPASRTAAKARGRVQALKCER